MPTTADDSSRANSGFAGNTSCTSDPNSSSTPACLSAGTASSSDLAYIFATAPTWGLSITVGMTAWVATCSLMV
ncbi:MAG: hypothetical protein ACK56I_30905, partial [bacterium]